MSIRRAQEHDIEDILRLLVEVNMVHHTIRPDLFKGPATKYNAQELAEKLQGYVILKGHYTAICMPDGHVAFNTTGNAGMATAGSGDVLTGMITGLLARGYQQREACILGVYLHGLAGDLAARELGEESLIASDIIQYLPKAFLKVKK